MYKCRFDANVWSRLLLIWSLVWSSHSSAHSWVQTLCTNKALEMDLKDDDPLMIGSFSDPSECNMPMVDSYHHHHLNQELTSGQSLDQCQLSIAIPSCHQQQHALSHSVQSPHQTTATPVISLFKLKNFLYQPKFKNKPQSSIEGEMSLCWMIYSCCCFLSQKWFHARNKHVAWNALMIDWYNLFFFVLASNGINNGAGVEDSSPTSHVSNNQVYTTSPFNRNLMSSSNSTSSAPSNQNSVSQIIALPQNFKLSNHLHVSNGTGRKYQCKMCPQVGLLQTKLLNTYLLSISQLASNTWKSNIETCNIS